MFIGIIYIGIVYIGIVYIGIAYIGIAYIGIVKNAIDDLEPAIAESRASYFRLGKTRLPS
ncbi:hypothetical protein [Photorhabdus laumondii]|uniref:Uncharacterized protein n=1 Tax=Photorhabdus laumondii subsp. clarkei TaxID=2029685 RepID=A0A329VKC8_9GAMM|nr:hypothetical protein [Photorhabdus laumondii]PQQ37585.1 hypothetical protein C6H68_12325 [Photorhabdus luminescens]RAW92239.1 hypothetical protein CKY01_04675 [Photorhabdus laumondii subsp. clarkei]